MTKKLMHELDQFADDVSECLMHDWADTLASRGVEVGDIKWEYDYRKSEVWFDADRQDAEPWLRYSSDSYILDRYPGLKKYVAMGGRLALRISRVGWTYYPDISLLEDIEHVIPGYNDDNPLKQLLITKLEQQMDTELADVTADLRDWYDDIRRKLADQLTDFAESESDEAEDDTEDDTEAA
jgi:hypothetical protein